uniref:Thioredoxin domain-containing protein n=1 Tax=Heterosigma akashiwo TaxID=2829 RepID=A0A6V1RKU1_HETAK|mmetsp:Transcript_5521/g.7726  ORF Transcript_5521/g.7726 Transcript_5521/m.7726 type:complete len:149 (+) Transcript_5521:132-578(+)
MKVYQVLFVVCLLVVSVKAFVQRSQGLARAHTARATSPLRMVLEVPEGDYEKEVVEASKSKPVLVDFWAIWCGPCRLVAPLMDKVQEEFGEDAIKVVKVDTVVHKDTVQRYKLEGLPRLIIFKDGEPVASHEGALPYAKLQEFVKGAL